MPNPLVHAPISSVHPAPRPRRRRDLGVWLSLLLLVLLAAAAHAAPTPVDRRLDAQPDAQIDVRVLTGTLTLIAWDESAVSIQGELRGEGEVLVVDGDPARLRIEVEPRGGWKPSEPTVDLTVYVPRAARIVANTVSADISVDALVGDVRLETVSGAIAVARARDARRGLEIKTVSGSVRVSGGLRIEVETVSGQLELVDVGGRIEIESVNGRTTVDGAGLGEVEVESVSGNIAVRGDLNADADVDLRSHMGSIALALPAESAARIQARTRSGVIESDFDGSPDAGAGSYGGERFEAVLGDGTAAVRLETFRGQITVTEAAGQR